MMLQQVYVHIIQYLEELTLHVFILTVIRIDSIDMWYFNGDSPSNLCGLLGTTNVPSLVNNYSIMCLPTETCSKP